MSQQVGQSSAELDIGIGLLLANFTSICVQFVLRIEVANAEVAQLEFLRGVVGPQVCWNQGRSVLEGTQLECITQELRIPCLQRGAHVTIHNALPFSGPLRLLVWWVLHPAC